MVLVCAGAGYVGIIVEESVGFKKAGVALLMAVSLWVIRATSGDPVATQEEAARALGEVSEVSMRPFGLCLAFELWRLVTGISDGR